MIWPIRLIIHFYQYIVGCFRFYDNWRNQEDLSSELLARLQREQVRTSDFRAQNVSLRHQLRNERERRRDLSERLETRTHLLRVADRQLSRLQLQLNNQDYWIADHPITPIFWTWIMTPPLLKCPFTGCHYDTGIQNDLTAATVLLTIHGFEHQPTPAVPSPRCETYLRFDHLVPL